MFRVMRSVFAALALLSVLTAGAVQARPLAPGAEPAGALHELWQWIVSGLAPVVTKDGAGLDPNGHKSHSPKPARRALEVSPTEGLASPIR